MLQTRHPPARARHPAELRDARTSPERFRALANRISVLLGAEALRDVPTVTDTVETPLGPCARPAPGAPTW